MFRCLCRVTWIRPNPFAAQKRVLLVQPASKRSRVPARSWHCSLPPSPAIHPGKSRVVRVYGTCLVAARYHRALFSARFTL